LTPVKARSRKFGNRDLTVATGQHKADMPKRIAIIQGHPDPDGGHLCHALVEAYADGAREAGHAVARVEVARIDFPWLRTAQEFENGELPPASFRRAMRLSRPSIW
jgi:hypothetical protein